ncbi:pyruvate dehydrogenase complex, E2 component, dihydrolipoyllysine-residue acetyltransferase [Hyphomonas neptunium ATCC 15444]|uniref:Acetyltransferase component of pyruvate dehydrogenase complex n=2 Tax=Hyphomonas TaxID=85 RepID=Q0C0R8_HYPNA|nr:MULTISPECIES: pyruvate dehydrogenase complex dihydrolipoamide acetyltransferase [Hyphomonas]ABI76488.1 pyruvate dehydrogenase complex, E2 component, dihydrolipoyllysine-residue acetyltransferase [Hyphomonas neptunium ATCC 15444]KCZ88240.1 pyruvate dehydrogenase complex, E2 component, dihydrolipoyllysine-residue acetyltransferase [Hyphomonas hirschiana VP5]
MAINITMPALSPTMEEGTLAKWLVKEGDTVKSGDIIAEIETDKATMEVEAVDEGTVAKIVVAEGSEGVKVNAVIAVLAEDGEDASSVKTPSADAAPKKEEKKEDAPKAGEKKPDEKKPEPKKEEAKPEPAKAAAPAKSDDGARLKASPLAKRIAANKGIDLKALKGSGPHGRIIKRDVESAKPGAQAATAGAAAPASPDGLILPQILDDRVYAPDTYELKPLDGMRKTVARRLTQSFMQVPHFPLNIDITLDNLLTSRASINNAAREGVKVSVNDLLIKAAALALMDEPDCNASFTDKGIAYHKHANVSVAVAVEGGLITPVIFKAETKGLAEISEEMKDLAARARERKLKPQEYMGGTFSISNLGMFGIKSFASIINPPEGMILSVGAGEKRAVVDEKGNVAVRTIMSVTLTCDHRVIGGAEGAKWLTAFKRYVETPEAMLL